MTPPHIGIKICGLLSPAMALACADAGADAIGMVFHPPSPRNIQPAQARAITARLPPHVAKVGVFVDQDTEEIARIAAQAGLDAVQLHTVLPGDRYARLTRHGLHVVQVLRSSGAELLAQACALPPAVGLLVECGRGALPGGNGAAWNWADAAVLRELRPFAVAGGLDPANVAQALLASGASAVDVSTGVESAPGSKDLARVAAFIAAVRAAGATSRGRVFQIANLKSQI